MRKSCTPLLLITILIRYKNNRSVLETSEYPTIPGRHPNTIRAQEIHRSTCEQDARSERCNPRALAKSFLKRKPSKVVVHKLDWRLPKRAVIHPQPAEVGRIPVLYLKRPTRHAPLDLRQPSGACQAVMGTTSSPGAFIDAHTVARLAALESAVYERCRVAREKASLARLEHQKDRKKFAATLQSQKQRSRPPE
jgi:hypothetical protein